MTPARTDHYIYMECTDPELIARHEHRHGQGAVQVRRPSGGEWYDRVGVDRPWARRHPSTADDLADWIARGWRYRLSLSATEFDEMVGRPSGRTGRIVGVALLSIVVCVLVVAVARAVIL